MNLTRLSRKTRWRDGARLSRLLSAALDEPCALCGGPPDRDGLCDACATAAHRERRGPRCTGCAIPLDPPAATRARCGDCLMRSPAFDAAVVGHTYAAPYDRLVLRLKFGGQRAAARPLARWLIEAVVRQRHVTGAIDAVVAIPLSRVRLVERGFNQARVLGVPLARTLRRPLRDDLLDRVTDHAPLAGLAFGARAQAVHGAFAARSCDGLAIALVDDVMTTGATFDAAATTLKRAGARRVVACAALRTPRTHSSAGPHV